MKPFGRIVDYNRHLSKAAAIGFFGKPVDIVE
jgi:hypothetical protein